MRVGIRHEEITTGLIFKKPRVRVVVTVKFSEIETEIIKHRKLLDYIVLERNWDVVDQEKADKDPTEWIDRPRPHLTIKQLLAGPDGFRLGTPISAKTYEAKVTEGLKTLKEFIDHNELSAKERTFEL